METASPMTSSASAAPEPQLPEPGAITSAPTATAPVRARVQIPGSKSLTNRHLIIAALSQTPSTISAVLDSRDTRLMIAALEKLGAKISADPQVPGRIRVTPLSQGAAVGEVRIAMGLAGTVMRFIPPVAGLVKGTVHCDGDPEARVRPMAGLLDGVGQAGVAFVDPDSDVQIRTPESLPFTIEGSGSVTGGRVEIDSGASSQFISGLLLAGAAFESGLDLVHTGQHTPSPEHVAMTVKVLRAAGVEVDDSQPQRWRIAPQQYSAPDVVVEPDLSNAGPYLVAAVVTGGMVEIPYWPVETTQIGDRWRDILPRFGARVEFEPEPGTDYGTLRVTGRLDEHGRPVVSGGGQIADTAELAPTVAALAVLAEGETTLTGIGHLRGHETDRLHAIATEASKVGAQVTETETSLSFTGRRDRELAAGEVLDSWADHRMATFAAVLGLVIPGLQIRDIATTAKTMPRFPIAWAQMVSSTGQDGMIIG